jgi:hypothetical protein
MACTRPSTRHADVYILLAVALTLSAAGCNLLGVGGGGTTAPEPGLLYLEQPDRPPPVALSADTVAAGTPVTVTVRTRGNGCYAKGPTGVRVQGRQATITPRDRVERDAEVCSFEMRIFEHEADVVFATPGTAAVQVQAAVGDAFPRGTAGRDTTVTRTVAVEEANTAP